MLAPPLPWLELLNVAARRWDWSQDQLEQLATKLGEIGFELVEPELSSVARWSAAGLTAYDAACVAVAEQSRATLITDDDEILRAAPAVTSRLDDTGHPNRMSPNDIQLIVVAVLAGEDTRGYDRGHAGPSGRGGARGCGRGGGIPVGGSRPGWAGG